MEVSTCSCPRRDLGQGWRSVLNRMAKPQPGPTHLTGTSWLIEDLLPGFVNRGGYLVDRHFTKPEIVCDLVDRDLELAEAEISRLWQRHRFGQPGEEGLESLDRL